MTGTGQYDLTMTRSEFDIEEDLNEEVEAKKDKEQLKEVVKYYNRVLSGIIDEVEEQPVIKKSDSVIQRQAEAKGQLMGNNKLVIMGALGKDLYNHVYEFLKYHRRKGTDERYMHEEIKKMVGGNKVMLNHCFNLDGIIFMELL